MTKLLLAILGLAFALAFTSFYKEGGKQAVETAKYTVIAKVEKQRHRYSRKW